MAKQKTQGQQGESTRDPQATFWSDWVDNALQRNSTFVTDGRNVVAQYRLERADAQRQPDPSYWRDKYNILYSSTETMRPSLYANTPKVEAKKRQRDRDSMTVTYATMTIENCGQYAIDEVDFDDVINNAVEDYLLPGLGVAWVRYEPEITKVGEGDDAYEQVSFEGLAVDYVNWEDLLTDDVPIWRNKKRIGRRCYFTKEDATDRFGEEKANKLQYAYQQPDNDRGSVRSIPVGGRPDQAIVYELWDKSKKEVVWYSADFPDGILDRKPDPLKLKGFWPCPRPLRAVSTTNKFNPKSFYSQYKSQAETLNDITLRIRILTKALRVVGVYDASSTELAKLLLGNDNKMVPVENWAMFASNAGINGSVQFLPIKDIATVLMELYKQREIAKAEIYEITGFGDIMRGVSKASETLGAQEIKNNWAQGRLRSSQKEVQRFCRDLLRIMCEIILEHFSDESIALYAGFEPPEVTQEEQAAAAQYSQAMLQWQVSGAGIGEPQPQPPPPTKRQQAVAEFKKVIALLKSEKTRCALVGIETDSTIQPDEAQERKDRLEFLASAGAFLQQAAPLAMQYPEMRGLLGGMLMFSIRTFRASRPLEKEFEDFTETLKQMPATPPPGEGDSTGDPAAAEAQVKSEEIKAQGQQQKTEAEGQIKKYEIDQRTAIEREKMQIEAQYKAQELEIKNRELALKEQELQLRMMELSIKGTEAQRTEDRADQAQAHAEATALDDADRADRQLEVDKVAATAKPAKKPKD